VARKRSILLVLPLVLAACGSAKTLTHTVTVSTGAAPNVSTVQLATLGGVAKRIYVQESHGTVDQGPLRSLEADSALVQAAARGDATASQAEANRAMVAAAHITGIRIVHGNRVLANAHLPFIVGGTLRPYRGVPGDQIEISIQDILGYVSLVHRVTAAEVVVRGSSGHALASLPALTRAKLPRSGRTQLAGRTYDVMSFGEPGWAGEHLTVWLLLPR
jgi:hypothetical protein